jgi:hypothetical protein
MLECELSPTPAALHSVFQTSCINASLSHHDEISSCEFQYLMLPKEAISHIAFNIIALPPPASAIDDQDQSPNTSVITNDNRIAMDNACISYQHGEQLCHILPGKYSINLLTCFTHWYPLIL